jgi:hypothetical protein
MDIIETLYLDWFNNFTSTERFADHHGMSLELANMVIEEGRETNHARG